MKGKATKPPLVIDTKVVDAMKVFSKRSLTETISDENYRIYLCIEKSERLKPPTYERYKKYALRLFSQVLYIADKLKFRPVVTLNAIDICHRILAYLENVELSPDIKNYFNISALEAQVRAAAVALFLSHKYHTESPYYYLIEKFSEICLDIIRKDPEYRDLKFESKEEIEKKVAPEHLLTLETWIWIILGAKVDYLKIERYIKYFSNLLNLSSYQKTGLYYYIYLSVLDLNMYKFLPSKIAAVAAYKAVQYEFNEFSGVYFRRDDEMYKIKSIFDEKIYSIKNLEQEMSFLNNSLRQRLGGLQTRGSPLYFLPSLCIDYESKTHNSRNESRHRI